MPEPVRIVFNISSESQYKCMKLRQEYIQFKVRTWRAGFEIGLFGINNNSQENQPVYNIKVGHHPWTESLVSLNKINVPTHLTVVNTPHIFGEADWRGFWVWIKDKTISFGKENECEPILSWQDENFEPIEKIGFRLSPYSYINNRPYFFPEPDSDDESDSRDSMIVIDNSKNLRDGTSVSRPTGVRWVKCSLGEIPENAVVGGHDSGNPLYVVRSMIHHALTPGKLMHGKLYCEVSWDCRENTLERYEVLTDFDGEWVRASEDEIPPNALLAGRSEDNHPLYVGRTEYRGTLTVGKVQPNHKSLYIPYGGQELSFKNYEILCYKHAVPPGIPHPPIPDTNNGNEMELKWIYSCNGRVPRNAFVVGDFMGAAVILIRGRYQGVKYPGWLTCGENKGHILASHYYEAIEEYEVLCDFHGNWEKPVDAKLPRNAVSIGKDARCGNIYVGRARHLGNMLCGPVDVRNMRCKIPYQKEEIWKESFEILCYPNPVESVTKRGLRYVKTWDL